MATTSCTETMRSGSPAPQVAQKRSGGPTPNRSVSPCSKEAAQPKKFYKSRTFVSAQFKNLKIQVEKEKIKNIIKPRDVVLKEDQDTLDAIRTYVSLWPERYSLRFQKWYVRRQQKAHPDHKQRTFTEWAVVYPEDVFHHLRNWDAGLRKSLIKNTLIDNTRKIVNRIYYKEKRFNQRSAQNGKHPHEDLQIKPEDSKLSYEGFAEYPKLFYRGNKFEYAPKQQTEETDLMVEQGDSGTTVDNLETSSSMSKTSNITFVDERPVDNVQLHTKGSIFVKDKSHDIAENNWSMNDVLTREFPLKDIEWKVTDSQDKLIINAGLPKLITDNTKCLITRQLKFFAFLRAGIKIRIQLNGTKFHCGRLIAYFVPISWIDDKEENFYGITSYPHFFLDASISNSGTLEIPFTHLLTYFSQQSGTMHKDDSNTLGRLVVRPYNPLRASDTASQSLFGQVYCSLMAPTVHLPTKEISQFSYSEGYIQGIEGLLKKGAGSLIDSGIGLMDKFTGGLVTGAGDAICNLLGICDKPLDPVSASPIINRTVAPLCHGAGLDRSTRLALTPASQTNTDPAILGAVDSDFNLLTLCKIPTLLQQFEWKSGDAPYSKLWDMLVTPVYLANPQYTQNATSRVANYTPTMLAYISRAFCYWRGSLKIKIQVVATQFHSGRLALVYDPHGSTNLNITDFDENKNHNVIIMDLQEEQELVIDLPYFAIKPWLRCDKFRSDANLENKSGITQKSYIDSDCTGVFRIFVLNSLVRPTNVVDSVQVNVFFYAGDNFELSVPNPVSPLSVNFKPGVQYANSPRYPWCKSPKDVINDYANVIYSLWLVGKNLSDDKLITPGLNWYDAEIKVNNYETIRFSNSMRKLKYYLEAASQAEKDYVNGLPNYSETTNGVLKDIQDVVSNTIPRIARDGEKTQIFKHYAEFNSQGVFHIEPESSGYAEIMQEEGMESYTTTRDSEGPSVEITSGNNTSSVAPRTLSEDAMNLQTLLRRYYPLYVSPTLKHSNDFTLIAIPVSPSFIPSVFEENVTSGLSRRSDLHNLAWFSRLYTYWRGSMRYKVLVNAPNSDVYVWHNPTDTKEFIVTSGFDHDHIADQLNFASDVAVTQVQQGLEVEVPFYSTFNQLVHTHIKTRQDLRANNGVLYIAVRNTENPFNLSIFISTGDDFFLNVLRSPPVLHEPWSESYTDSADYYRYPEIQKALTMGSGTVQVPGTYVFDSEYDGYYYDCSIPDFSSNKDDPHSHQMMQEQMFSSLSNTTKAIENFNEIKESYEKDIKPLIPDLKETISQFKTLTTDLNEQIIPQVLGHAKTFHQDLNDTHDTIKGFLPKIDEALSFHNAAASGIKFAADQVKYAGECVGDYASYMTRFMSMLNITGVYLNVQECLKKFKWIHVLNVITNLCVLLGVNVPSIIKWLWQYIQEVYEDCRSKVPYGAMSEQGLLEEFVAEHHEETVVGLAAIATIIYCALFSNLPSMSKIKQVVKMTVEGSEQGLADNLKNIHFSNLGIKAIATSFDFFKEWVEKLVCWFLGTETPELMLATEFKEQTAKIQKWMTEISKLEDEDFYHLALTDINIHNRFYALADEGVEFTNWLLKEEKVSPSIAIIVRDANRKLGEMIKRINEIRPGHGYRYAPFVVCFHGETSTGKSEMMHHITQQVRENLNVPVYNSVYAVPSNDKYLSGYEGQPIVEWDDMLQNTEQDSMVAEFVQWCSNADTKINMADLAHKGTHFVSKAIICTTNCGYVNVNCVRDMDAFRRRRNVMIGVQFAPGHNKVTMKTATPDPEFKHARFALLDESNEQNVLRPNLTWQEVKDLINEAHLAWDRKQNQKLAEYFANCPSMRIPKGVVIVEETVQDAENEQTEDVEFEDALEEQSVTDTFQVKYKVNLNTADLSEEEQIDAELFQITFDDFTKLEKRSAFERFKAQTSNVYKSIKKSKLFELLSRKLSICVNDFIDKCKLYYSMYPMLFKTLSVVASISVCAGFLKVSKPYLASLFGTESSSEESNYNDKIKTTKNLIVAEHYQDTTKVTKPLIKAEHYSETTKTNKNLIKAEHYENSVKTYQKIVRAEAGEEGTCDPEAVNLARNKIHPLLTLIGWEDGSVLLQGISVFGKTLLTPHHFFRRAKPGQMFWFLRGQDKIPVEFIPEHLFRIRDKDACLYFLGPQFDSRKSIIKCFLEEKFLSKISTGVDAILVGTNLNGIIMEKAGRAEGNVTMHYQGSDEGAPIYTQNGWKYPFNTLNGECGSMLIATSKSLPPPAKIIGMHVAGYSNKRGGFSVLLSQEMIVETILKMEQSLGKQVLGASLPPQVIQDEQAFNEKVTIVPDGHFSLYGVMDPKFCPSQPHKTKLTPTPFQGELYPVVKAPAMLKPTDGKSPLKLALGKYGKLTKPFKHQHIKAVANSILNDFKMLNSDIGYKPVSDEMAIFGDAGVDYVNKMNMKSSPGWPYQCLSNARGQEGKAYLFDINNRKIKDSLLETNLRNRETLAKQGERYPSIWRDCLKDELRPLEKVEAGKTRLFTIAPCDFTILVRKYFLPFIQAFYAGYSTFFSAVGINAESYDWTAAYNRLRTYGNKCVAGDFAAFDGTLMAWLIAELGEVINEWFRFKGDDDPVNALVRRVLIDEMIHTYQLCQNCVYKTHQGNPSGNPLTVIINTAINAFYMRLAWMEIMLEQAPALATMDAYHEHVIEEMYGDDNRLVVKESVLRLFNQLTITECLARHGIGYTDEEKSDAVQPFKLLEETSFLKRRYRKDPEIGEDIMLPVMNLDTITSLTNWYREGNDVKEQLIANQRAALGFAFFHGRQFYNDFYSKFSNELIKLEIKPVNLSYDELLIMFTNDIRDNGTAFCNLMNLDFSGRKGRKDDLSVDDFTT